MKLPIQLDRYALVEAIGAGAFGRVYRAEVRGDMGFVSDFAVKVLDSNVVHTNPNVAAQMADEARLLSQLDHPNIVKVIDFKHVDHFVLGDVYMMVLEFVRGVDVAEVLERLAARKAHIPASAVLYMGLMVADALNHAQSMTTRDGTALSLVHRDLKPHNLMVNFRGQVKILDFGIAKAKSARMAAATQEGQTKGTVFYMSPEQLAGEELDGRSDLYSLGTILFELLLGRRLLDVEVHTPADLARAMHTAFDLDVEERLSVLRAHLKTGANGALPDEAIEGWLALLRAVLQKDARYRPDGAKVFAEQLEWLRHRHPSAEAGERDFWVRVVEEVAADRAARGGPRLPPPPTPVPRRVETVEDLPADISRNGSAQDFFGMESGAIVEEQSARPAAGSQVPMTREMSSVRGSVRTFGSSAVQQISPLPDVMRQITATPGPSPRASGSADSLTVQEVERGIAEARGHEPVEAPTVEGPAVRPAKGRKPEPAKGKASSPLSAEAKSAAPAPTAAPRATAEPARPLTEPPTTPIPLARPAAAMPPALSARKQPSSEPAPVGKRAVVARRPGRNRHALAVLGGLAALLALAVVGLTVQRIGSSQDIDPEVAAAALPEVESAGPTEPATAGADLPSTRPPSDAAIPPVDPPKAPAATEPTPTRQPTPGATSKPPSTPTAEPTPSAPRPTPTPRPAPEAVAAAAGPEMGTLHLSARPSCDVEIDGAQRGTTDDTRKGLTLAPGTYKVRFVCANETECAGFARRSGKKTLVVEAGKKTRYHADFYQLNKEPE